MATTKQVQAAKRNVRKAQKAARSQRTITKLPASTRRDLGRQAAKSRARGGRAGHNLEDRNRTQLYETAKRLGIAGRSKMGKWDLIHAIRRARWEGGGGAGPSRRRRIALARSRWTRTRGGSRT